tara:strand:+ start:5166 stop:5507 length:342 start_codon:yes stop_codon:yes gene_type:complete
MPSTLVKSYVTRLRNAATRLDAQQVMQIWHEAGLNETLGVSGVVQIHQAKGVSDMIFHANQACQKIKLQHLNPSTELPELSELKKDELIRLCKLRSVGGYSKLNRGQLIELLS